MDRVIIVGAGGFGRELLAYLLAHPACGRDWEVAGFLDDDPQALGGRDVGREVLGPVAGYRPRAGERLVCAIGLPAVKRRVCEALEAAGAEFMCFVHPSVILGERVRLGRGVVLCPRVTLTADIELGDFVALNCHSSAGHDVQVGDFATLSGHCDLTGGCRVGAGAFLGSGARVLPGKSVGEDARVGAGAVVIASVAAGTTVFGNPARPI